MLPGHISERTGRDVHTMRTKAGSRRPPFAASARAEIRLGLKTEPRAIEDLADQCLAPKGEQNSTHSMPQRSLDGDCSERQRPAGEHVDQIMPPDGRDRKQHHHVQRCDPISD